MILENAGRLKNEAIDEIEEFMLNKNHKNIIALVDVVNNFDKMAVERATFIDRFDVYSVLSDLPQESLEKNNKVDNNLYENNKNVEITQNTNDINEKKETETIKKVDDNINIKIDNSLISKAIKAKTIKEKNIKERENDISTKNNEMSKDEFVEFCKKYAKSIDCVMPGKAIPALYEKIEDLIEDGIELNEQNAIELMEETADRAEKPRLFSKPKYDKDGCLILSEEHFI